MISFLFDNEASHQFQFGNRSISVDFRTDPPNTLVFQNKHQCSELVDEERSIRVIWGE